MLNILLTYFFYVSHCWISKIKKKVIGDGEAECLQTEESLADRVMIADKCTMLCSCFCAGQGCLGFFKTFYSFHNLISSILRLNNVYCCQLKMQR